MTVIEQMIADKLAEIAELNLAITAVLKNQSYTLDDGQGKTIVTRANLQTLYDRKDKLEGQIIDLGYGGSIASTARLL